MAIAPHTRERAQAQQPMSHSHARHGQDTVGVVGYRGMLTEVGARIGPNLVCHLSSLCLREEGAMPCGHSVVCATGSLQERMSQNHVYVFAKKAPTKFSFIAEIKSCPDSGETPRARILPSISHPLLPVIRFHRA